MLRSLVCDKSLATDNILPVFHTLYEIWLEYFVILLKKMNPPGH